MKLGWVLLSLWMLVSMCRVVVSLLGLMLGGGDGLVDCVLDLEGIVDGRLCVDCGFCEYDYSYDFFVVVIFGCIVSCYEGSMC